MKNNLKLLALLPVLLLTSCNFTFEYKIEGLDFGGMGDQEDDGIEDAGTYDIKVWVDDKIENLTRTQIQTFVSENGGKYKLNVKVEPMSEGNATSSMLLDVQSGADIFCFAQDQLARLKVAGALAKMNDFYVSKIKEENSEDSVKAASLGHNIYAFPMTSDNGYFLYYDKRVFNADDVKNMSTLLNKIKQHNDSTGSKDRLYFKAQSDGFYSASYFLAKETAGGEPLCHSNWTLDDETGKFLAVDDTFAGANGLIAAKGIQEINDKNLVVSSDNSANRFGNGAVAVVTGIWDYQTAVTRLGEENLGCAELPIYTVGGKDYHLGSFDGYKLMGVKPLRDQKKASVCRKLARYLTGDVCQTQRFREVSWGPTNKNASERDEIKTHKGLSALMAQHQYATQQGQCPGAWFVSLSTMAKTITKDKSDADIQAVLDAYKKTLPDLLSED